MGLGSSFSLLGTGIGAFASWMRGKKADDRAEAQAENLRVVAEHNKEISLFDASVAEKDAALGEASYGYRLRNHLRMIDNVVGSAKARLGKSGVALGEGSALDTIIESVRAGAEDAALIRAEGKTLYERRRNIAERYRKLAEFGMRDAANQAALIEDAGADEAMFGTLTAGAQLLGGIFEFGEYKGWWQ